MELVVGAEGRELLLVERELVHEYHEEGLRREVPSCVSVRPTEGEREGEGSG